MRDIPLAVYNRLKARQQIGDYRPNHEVEILDQAVKTRGFTAEGTGSEDPTSNDFRPTKIIQGYDNPEEGYEEYSNERIGNWVPTSDGRFVCAWPQVIDDTSRIVLGYTSSEANFFTQDYPVEEIVVIEDITFHQAWDCSLYRHRDGEIFLFVKDRIPYEGNPWTEENPFGMNIKCYVSASGSGHVDGVSDFAYHSTIWQNIPHPDWPEYEGGWNRGMTYEPAETSGGNFLLACNVSMGVFSTGRIYMSEDKFLTWKPVAISRFFGHAAGMTKPVELPDGTIFSGHQHGSGAANLYISEAGGHSFANADASLRSISERTQSYFGSFVYDPDTNVVYRHSAGTYSGCGIHILENPTPERFMDPDAWEFIMYTDTNRAEWTRMYITPGDRIAVHWSDRSGRTVILGISPPEGVKLRAKEINISRSRTAASSLNVLFDNKDGILTPERGTAETNDYFKLLWMNNEIIIRQGYGTDLVQTFSGLIDRPQPSRNPDVAEIEVVARDHFKKCLDQTITVGSQNHAIHAVGPVEGIFRQLAQMAGFSNEKIFTEATGMSVEKEFSWETYADAMQYLAEIVNYEIITDEYGNIHFLPQEMRGDVLEYDYVFREGEDIVRIDYEIDDDDLYYEVVVHGKNDDDEVIEVRASYTPREYYQVLEQKILKVDTELSTVAECQELADRTVQLMLAKPRCADFAAIAVPWLQVGDKILVEESSTTISEIYRIDEMDLMQEPDSFLMTLRTHHYAQPGGE